MTSKEVDLLERMVAVLDAAAPVSMDPRDSARELGVPMQAAVRVSLLGVSAGVLVACGGGLVYPRTTLVRLVELCRGVDSIVALRDRLATTRRFAEAIADGWVKIGLAERDGGSLTLV